VTIDINPVLLSVGPLAVRWFGLLSLAGLGLAIGLSLRELTRQRLGHALGLDALAWGLPAAIVCARVTYVLGHWEYYLTSTSALWQLNIDGLSLWGGLLGGALVGAARLSRDAYKRRRILDAIAPNAALGIALGRLGQFLDGHGQGLPAQLPWATQYTSRLAATPDFGVPRHPAQLYDALIALLLFALLRSLPRRLPVGSRFAAFLVLYGAARVGLGAVRLDPAFLFGLQVEQLLAIVAVGMGAIYGARPLVRRAGGVVRAVPAQRASPEEDSVAAA
jgi:phosphatidylglycerol:prolipoprotein diacylglycerol transferase